MTNNNIHEIFLDYIENPNTNRFLIIYDYNGNKKKYINR